MNHNFSYLFENDFLALFPEIFLFISTIFLLLYGVVLSTSKQNGRDSLGFFPEVVDYPILVQNIGGLGLLSIGLTFCLLCHNPIEQSLLFYNTLIIDDFTFFFKTLLLLSSFGAIFISGPFLANKVSNSLTNETVLRNTNTITTTIDMKYSSQIIDNKGMRLAGKLSELSVGPAFEYMILILFSTLSMLLMISSYDFISMYLTIELQSLSFYVLAASKRNSEFSTEAGLKYFILGAFSSGILLFGCSMVYGFTGITNFNELAKLLAGSTVNLSDLSTAVLSLNSNYLVNSGLSAAGVVVGPLQNGVIIGIIFIAVGFLFKLTAAPFHMWAPDVYEGSPTNITAFFAIAPKVALLAVFMRLFLFSFYDFLLPWQKIILFCSMLSMFIGAFAAMAQYKIKRLLAYSSIGHIGYILLGFSCASIEGIEGLFIYLIIYIVMTINLFAIILSLQGGGNIQHNMVGQRGRLDSSAVIDSQDRDEPMDDMDLRSSFMSSIGAQRPQQKETAEHFKYITDLGILSKTNPLLALTLTCTMFSMAGIPPLAGFCSKFYIFFAALSSSLYLLAFVGIFTSVISCFYYIRLIKIMYFDKPTKWANSTWSSSMVDKEKSIILGLTLGFILFFFLYPSPLFLVAHKVAISLAL